MTGAQWLVSLPIRGYRRWLSPLKRQPSCRFVPTCSEYALEAVRQRGAVVGLALTVWRILRCNPLCKGGFDPVEPRLDPQSRHALACPGSCPHGRAEESFDGRSR